MGLLIHYGGFINNQSKRRKVVDAWTQQCLPEAVEVTPAAIELFTTLATRSDMSVIALRCLTLSPRLEYLRLRFPDTNSFPMQPVAVAGGLPVPEPRSMASSVEEASTASAV